jgi:uncharacterized repeat protein (TIGR03803 family)
VFKLDKAGKQTVFHNFSGADGQTYTGLIRDKAGHFYGTTAFGGPVQCGVVFMLDATGRETILHNFIRGADGGFPFGDLILDKAGNLYGTTSVGGDSDFGAVFMVTPWFRTEA